VPSRDRAPRDLINSFKLLRSVKIKKRLSRKGQGNLRSPVIQLGAPARPESRYSVCHLSRYTLWLLVVRNTPPTRPILALIPSENRGPKPPKETTPLGEPLI